MLVEAILVCYSAIWLVNASPRIIGGTTIPITSAPYQASLRYLGNHICGASLIAPTLALSAAHCFQSQGSYSVKVGSAHLTYGGVIVHVTEVILHPDYRSYGNDYDIGLLFLARPLVFTDKVRAVALPDPAVGEVVRRGMIGRVSGWGYFSLQVKGLSEDLRMVEVPVWGEGRCERSYWGGVSGRSFCAGLMRGGRDSCMGDSGGPLVVGDILYGIVSYGMDCAQPGYPGVYTDVAALRGFILQYGGL